MTSRDAVFLHTAKWRFRNDTPLCRVQLSFEPAFAGWGPPRVLRLGSGLSRHTRKIGTRFVGVGSKPGCSNTHTAGLLILYHKTRCVNR